MVFHGNLIDIFRSLFVQRDNRITQDEIITPTTAGMFFQPAFIPRIIDPNIAIFKNAISEAQRFIKDTFKKPPPRACGGTGQFSCGKFNFTTFPKGSRFSVNPFTGTRLSIPAGPRASQKTIDFLGGAAQLSENLRFINAGNLFKSQIQDFISNFQGRLNILTTAETAEDNRQIAILEAKFV